MSVICAAQKDGIIAIAGDSQLNFGSLTVSPKHLKHSEKFVTIGNNIIGIVGWTAISTIIEHLAITDKKIFNLKNRQEIFSTLLKLQEKLKDDFYIETNEDDDQPVESNQLDAIIINRNGIFEIGSYREVYEYNNFWAIGSGRKFSLGAMNALYESKATAEDIVKAGVEAAIEFDDSCGAPITVRTLDLAK